MFLQSGMLERNAGGWYAMRRDTECRHILSLSHLNGWTLGQVLEDYQKFETLMQCWRSSIYYNVLV